MIDSFWSKFRRLKWKTEDKEYEINIFDFSFINEDFRLYWGNIMLIYSAKNIEINTNSVTAKNIKFLIWSGNGLLLIDRKYEWHRSKAEILSFQTVSKS